jgi:hypothetical protein
VTESLQSSEPGAQKRRSTRIAQAVPITVAGVDALGQPFKERTTTVMVNCHGCKYQSKHYVPKNSSVTLEIPRMEPAFPPRIVQGHVVWVQRPRTVRELFQIGLEFETPANVWGIAFPPEDWVPFADEKPAEAAEASEEIEMDVEIATNAPAPASPASAVAPPSPAPPAAAVPPAPVGTPPAAPAASTPSNAGSEAKIHVMPSPAVPSQDAQAAIARQMAKVVAEAKESLDKTLKRGAQTAINEEMANVRQQLDAQMHETIEHAIKASMERIAESEVKKLIQQVANKAAVIVEEARRSSETQVAQIDAKVRDAVQRATSEAAEQAAKLATSQVAALTEETRRTTEANLQQAEERTRKAAQEAVNQAAAITSEARKTAEANLQLAEDRIRKTAEDAARLAANRAIQETVAHNLKQSVETVVERVIAEREAKVPSLQVLTSPEAAQAHIEEWKKNLEAAAEEVRNRSTQQSQSEAEAANRKWREEIEAMTASSSARVGEKLNGLSQAALASAEKEFVDRSLALRTGLNEVISQAGVSVQSLGSKLVQERSNAEQLQSETQATIQKWRAEFEVQATGSSTKLRETLSELSQSALANAEKEIAERTASLRTRLNDAISQREALLQSLGSELAQQRADAEQAKTKLEEAAKSTLEQTQRQIDQLAAAQQDSIAQRSEALISERIQSIDPILAQAAQNVMDRFSGEIERKVGTKVDEAYQTISEITDALARAAELRASLNHQMQQATAQATQIQDSIEARVQQVSNALVQKAVTELSSAQQEIARLQNDLRQQAQQVSEGFAKSKSGAVEHVQQASAEAVQAALTKLASASQEANREQTARGQAALSKLADAAQEGERLQNELRQQAQQLSEEIAQSRSGAVEYVQQASSDAVQAALTKLAEASQVANREQTVRGQAALSKLTDAAQQAERLQNQLRQEAQQFSEEVAQSKSGALEYVQQASSEALQAALSKLADATQQATHLQEAIRVQVEHASGQVTLIQHAAQERVQKESEAAVQKAVTDLSFAGQEVLRLQESIREQKQIASELAEEAGRLAQDKIRQAANELVQGAVSELQNSVAQAAQIQASVRDDVQQAETQFAEMQKRVREEVRAASEQEARESLERVRQEAAKMPSELEQACRASITRMEEELDQKSAEMQHSAYEALLKAAEWYQKKAQTNMQSTMERLVEQSSNAMKDKAGEVSSMVAAELDHYRRSYLEHGQMEFEEAAKEVLDRQRLRLNETSEIAAATFTDRVQHAVHESLQRFQQESLGGIEKAHADLQRKQEGALEQFQKNLDEKMTQGVEHAATYLHAQLIPLLESWEEKRQVEQREWMEQMKESAEEAIAAYKARLENTTNGWLLASAATLGQNSQAVLDALSKAAERQLRDSCSRVLAGMGETLKDRLLGISTAFRTEEREESEKSRDSL